MIRTTFISLLVLAIAGFRHGHTQVYKDFPIDPYAVLKSWNYDRLVRAEGNGKEILGTVKNQTFLSGLSYPYDWLGSMGELEFTFDQENIRRIQFRKDYPTRPISSELADRIIRDTLALKEYNLGIQKLDSLRRDSVIRSITTILGPPISSGRTAATEKNVRYSATWINRGYACLFKDYVGYGAISFTLSTVPFSTTQEFGVPEGTEVLRKIQVNLKRSAFTASLLGNPRPGNPLGYDQVFLYLEYPGGQRFMTEVTGGRDVYLPDWRFEDCDGNAMPEVWIITPLDTAGTLSRHYLYSILFREPLIVFNTDDLLPSTIQRLSDSKVELTFPDGSTGTAEMPEKKGLAGETVNWTPQGFDFLNTTPLNKDGSANFIGGIRLNETASTRTAGLVEITYRYIPGGWEPAIFRIRPPAVPH